MHTVGDNTENCWPPVCHLLVCTQLCCVFLSFYFGTVSLIIIDHVYVGSTVERKK